MILGKKVNQYDLEDFDYRSLFGRKKGKVVLNKVKEKALRWEISSNIGNVFVCFFKLEKQTKTAKLCFPKPDGRKGSKRSNTTSEEGSEARSPNEAG